MKLTRAYASLEEKVGIGPLSGSHGWDTIDNHYFIICAKVADLSQRRWLAVEERENWDEQNKA